MLSTYSQRNLLSFCSSNKLKMDMSMCDLGQSTDVYLYQTAFKNHAWLIDKLEHSKVLLMDGHEP